MTDQDAEYLLNRPEFRRFLFAAIQTAGMLSQKSPADGQIARDFEEGRRSLGFDLLHMAHAGQPEAIRTQDPHAIATLDAVLREAMNPKEKPRGRRSDDTARFKELDDDQ